MGNAIYSNVDESVGYYCTNSRVSIKETTDEVQRNCLFRRDNNWCIEFSWPYVWQCVGRTAGKLVAGGEVFRWR